MIFVNKEFNFIFKLVHKEKYKFGILEYDNNYNEISKKGENNFKKLERKQTVRQNFISDLYAHIFNANNSEVKEE